MAKPAGTPPRFGNLPGVQVEPTEGKKDAGWVQADRPPAEYMNWIQGKTYDWLSWLHEITPNSDIQVPSAKQFKYTDNQDRYTFCTVPDCAWEATAWNFNPRRTDGGVPGAGTLPALDYLPGGGAPSPRPGKISGKLRIPAGATILGIDALILAGQANLAAASQSWVDMHTKDAVNGDYNGAAIQAAGAASYEGGAAVPNAIVPVAIPILAAQVVPEDGFVQVTHWLDPHDSAWIGISPGLAFVGFRCQYRQTIIKHVP